MNGSGLGGFTRQGCEVALNFFPYLGKPPRRLVLLHLDGSDSDLPANGDEVTTAQGKVIGFIGTAARHFELGPIATAVIKRSTPTDETLHVLHEGNVITANQEVVVL